MFSDLVFYMISVEENIYEELRYNFYVCGHRYEFDFGTKQCNWYQLERFCELMLGRSDIVYYSNRDAIQKHSFRGAVNKHH